MNAITASGASNRNGQPHALAEIDETNGALPKDIARRNTIRETLAGLDASHDGYAVQFVEHLLRFAREVGTSDVHLQPTADGIDLRYRSDGVLNRLGTYPVGKVSSPVSRLKILSGLLSYRSDFPQEGRIIAPEGPEIRVSTFPTLYGERAVLRLFGAQQDYRELHQLGHSDRFVEQLKNALAETSGAILIAGPAGSGKSTTLYASLRHLVQVSTVSRSIVSLEDPIEVPIPGVAQSQVNPSADFTLHSGLRAMLRQDPEVIIVGEIRDKLAAEVAIEASLTGQLMLTTFHAESAATAVSRLTEMGIEPYLLRSGVIAIVCQRLLRTLCDCSVESHDQADFFGLPIDWARKPVGCETCDQTGFRGRVVTSEFLDLRESNLAQSILQREDSRKIYRLAVDHGMESLWERATVLVREGITSPCEVRRVLGVSMRL